MSSIKPFTHTLDRVDFVEIVKQHAPGFKVTYFTEDQSVADAFDGLARAGILSAPIVAPSQATVNVYVDLVDVYDLVSFAITAFIDANDQPNLSAVAEACESSLKERTLGEILATEGRNDDIGFVSSVLARSVQSLINNIFFRPVKRLRFNRTHVHRVAVMDPEGALLNIVSMSDVLRFIIKHPKYLEPNGALPIGHIPIGKNLAQDRSAICISESAPTISAFMRIQREGLHCLVVTDAAGRAVGGISPGELRHFTGGWVKTLAEPTGAFLAASRSGFRTDGSSSPVSEGSVFVAPSTELRTVIEQMLAAKQHYVVAVDADRKPLFVVTMTDVLRLFVTTE